MSANRIRVHSQWDWYYLLSPAYTTLIRDHHTQGVHKSTAIYILYRNHRIIEAPTPYTYFLVTPLAASTFQTSRLCSRGFHHDVGCCVCWVVVTRSRQGELMSVLASSSGESTRDPPHGYWVVESSSWVLFLVMVSRGACLRNCHLLCGLSHHHRCDALGLWEV